MKSELTKNGNELIVRVEGSLDTNNAPILDEQLSVLDDNIETVTFDFENLDYIASSGLRVMIKVLKTPGPDKRNVKVINAHDFILDILNTTGLDEFMEIEQ